MSSKQFQSPNFNFLATYDDVLVRHAALAERYVFDDANGALVKLRQFAELLAEHCAAFGGILVEERDSFLDILDKLWNSKIVGPQVSQLFHGLRKAGNDAAHNNAGEKRDALHQLQMARKLAVWFHKSFGRDKKFSPGPFVPPPDPSHANSELQDELDRLRNELTKVKQESEGALSTEEARKHQLREYEKAANEAYEELNTALELAEESEKQLQEERSHFQEKLATLQSEVSSQPKEIREAAIATAFDNDSEADLDEVATRRIIDSQLKDAGWEADSEAIRYSKGTRPVKGRNLAIAEWPTENGPADYCLFVGLKPIAIVEAKRKNKNVCSAIEQSKRYSRGFVNESEDDSPGGPWGEYKIPFLFSTNGGPYLRQIAEKSGVWFLDGRQSTNHPRALESWYSPEGLSQLLNQNIEAADERLESESVHYLPLRDYQSDAVRAVEKGIAKGQRDMLLAMATGTGKTRTAICLIYRLIKAGRFRRVLFLVDRRSLGEQAEDSFEDIRLENHQSFTEIYDIKQLGELKPDTETKLHIATIQGMVKRLLYSDSETDSIPVDSYDCIIVDECHRGYNLDQEMTDNELSFRNEVDYVSKYRRVLDHFDAIRIGLTATPALHTTEIFGPPIFQYTYRQAVIDGWLVDHEPPFLLKTKLSQEGIKWEQGDEVKILDSKNNQLELFNTPDEVQVEIDQFNKKVLTENFNRTVCNALAERIDPTFPGKTLIFCATDLHADMVVRLLKVAFEEQYGPLDDNAVVKITGAADKPSQLIRRFKNEQLPSVVVTVDLLTTGIDVPAITNVVFLRRVKSRILFEQMLGRATRLCEDLHGIGDDKEKFFVYDAVDLYSALQDVSEMTPVVTRANISLDQLIEELCSTEDEEFRSDVKDQLLARLRRKKFSDNQLEKLETETGFDRHGFIDHIRNESPGILAEWFRQNQGVASILNGVNRSFTKYLVSEHEDELLSIEQGYGDAKKPEDYLESFRNYVKENLNELPALIVVAQRPRDLKRKELRELKLALDNAGFSVTRLQSAWRETTNQDIAASIIGYIRHVACEQPLIAYKDRVQKAMDQILSSRSWTMPQRRWLERIGKQLEQEIIVDRDALDAGQFKEMGGFTRMNKVFNGELESILKEISDSMWQTAV